jgi:RNA polymerase sigma factor (sigma-70 family)
MPRARQVSTAGKSLTLGRRNRAQVDTTPGWTSGIIPNMTAQPAATVSSVPATTFRFSGAHAEAVTRCWGKAAAPVEWGLTQETFEAALARSTEQRFSGSIPSDKQIEAYLDGLHVRDLALARACAAGNEAAWELFVAEYRLYMYRAARAIARRADNDDGGARELADSLYADLYGLRESSAGRKSLFDYFHGRSKLSTWLRAVLAQRHVDEIRRTQKIESIDTKDGEERNDVAFQANRSVPGGTSDPARAQQMAMLQAAVVSALDQLSARDRLRLAYYYADERTLAEIGQLLGEHEATASRKLDRTRRDLRRAVEAILRNEKRLSGEQVRACFEHAREEWPFDLMRHLRSD